MTATAFEMAKDERCWPYLREKIKREQVALDDVFTIMESSPEFSSWYTAEEVALRERPDNVVLLRPNVARRTKQQEEETQLQANMALSTFVFDLIKLVGPDGTIAAMEDTTKRLRATFGR